MPPVVNHLNESEVRQYRETVLAALRDLSQGSVPFLVGVRRLASLAGDMRERDPEFDLLVAIESETDHLPNESAKRFCSAAWLKKCEEEEQQVEAVYKEQVVLMCAKLTARFSSPPSL